MDSLVCLRLVFNHFVAITRSALIERWDNRRIAEAGKWWNINMLPILSRVLFRSGGPQAEDDEIRGTWVIWQDKSGAEEE